MFYNLELVLYPSSNNWIVSALHKPTVLPRFLVLEIVEEFNFTLSHLCNGIKAPEKDFWRLSPQQQKLIHDFGFGEKRQLEYECLHHSFENQVKLNPNFVAVEQHGTHILYSELNVLAQRLSSLLVNQGAGVGKRVAIVIDRCIEFPLAILSILKTGASFVPIDSSFPKERIKFMIQDSSAAIILTIPTLEEKMQSLNVSKLIPVIYIDRENLNSRLYLPNYQHALPSGETEAYCIYTSGSTGTPKGVSIIHRGVTNAILDQSVRLGCLPGSRMLQFMAIGFDACQHEIWSALSSGSTLVLREEDLVSSVSKVDSFVMTPTGLSLIGEPYLYKNLKNVSVGGEACPLELKNLWCEQVKFNNFYGPTEISILSHAATISKMEPVTVGRPIANTSCFLLNESFNLVPRGVVGEVFIGGFGISNGYINLHKLTSDRFLSLSLYGEKESRFFRTGDYGRLLNNGHFEIIGRSDAQVKIRGYRIELDEISSVLMQFDQVSSASVIVKNNTDLVAFVTPADVDIQCLRDFAIDILPFYMVPRAILAISNMPMTINGKVYFYGCSHFINI
jgi:amino acid adenylation domain-containing protein